ncbi:hypothetical protein D9M70_541280 [compost metagenome]
MAFDTAAGEDRRHMAVGDRLARRRTLQGGRFHAGVRRAAAGLQAAVDPALEQGNLGVTEKRRSGHRHARLGLALEPADQFATRRITVLHHRTTAAFEQLVETGQAQAQGRRLTGVAHHAAGLEDRLDIVECRRLRRGHCRPQQQPAQRDPHLSLAHVDPPRAPVSQAKGS